MIRFLIFLIGLIILIIGACIGFFTAAVLKVGSDSDDLEEAYQNGFKDGVAALKDVNNLYNKYKDMANRHNNIKL